MGWSWFALDASKFWRGLMLIGCGLVGAMLIPRC